MWLICSHPGLQSHEKWNTSCEKSDLSVFSELNQEFERAILLLLFFGLKKIVYEAIKNIARFQF